MDFPTLRKLIELVQEMGIAELEVTLDGERVRIVNRPAPSSAIATTIPIATYTPSDEPAGEPPIEEDGRYLICATMVGTFYRSPSPDTPPFATVGQVINAGDTLCIIEAMKLLNEIESEHAGTIIEILVESGQPVEYGQPLFVMRPNG